MEARLARKPGEPEPAPAKAEPTGPAAKAEPSAPAPDASELVVVAHERVNESAAEEPPNWPDEAAESAFLAEAREHGETPRPATAQTSSAEASAEEPDPKALPPLDELVNRIPAEVREVLEDLFRARFVMVKRVPKKALKP